MLGLPPGSSEDRRAAVEVDRGNECRIGVLRARMRVVFLGAGLEASEPEARAKLRMAPVVLILPMGCVCMHVDEKVDEHGRRCTSREAEWHDACGVEKELLVVQAVSSRAPLFVGP